MSKLDWLAPDFGRHSICYIFVCAKLIEGILESVEHLHKNDVDSYLETLIPNFLIPNDLMFDLGIFLCTFDNF